MIEVFGSGSTAKPRHKSDVNVCFTGPNWVVETVFTVFM